MALPPFVYSPFVRDWDQLDNTDIKQLKDASEGWNIEYKRDVPKAEAAGKSLSSFANSYGGWLFYGVETPSGGASMPTSFPGIDNLAVPSVLEMLQRGAVLVRPHPFFEHKIITGPDVVTGLPADKSLVVVRVPPGAQAPYIHNNGRIYRRIADSSEPTHETDRHILDLLWQRSNDARNQWRDIVTQEFVVSRDEERQPTVHVFLTCDPHGDRGAELPLNFDAFVDLMREPRKDSGGLPFDNFFTAPYSFVARQVAKNDPYNLLLTWRQRLDGTAVVSFPLAWSSVGEAQTWLEGYTQAARFHQLLDSSGLTKGRILDLCTLAHLLTSIVDRYRFLLREANIKFDFYGCTRIDHVWRSVPFIDVPEYSELLEKYGIPLIQHEAVRSPESVDGLWNLENWPTEYLDRFLSGFDLFSGAAASLGAWLEPKALLKDWSGLSSRGQDRMVERTSRSLDRRR